MRPTPGRSTSTATPSERGDPDVAPAPVAIVVDGTRKVAFVDAADADAEQLATAVADAVASLVPGEAVLTVYSRQPDLASVVIAAGGGWGFEPLEAFGHDGADGTTTVLRRRP